LNIRITKRLWRSEGRSSKTLLLVLIACCVEIIYDPYFANRFSLKTQKHKANKAARKKEATQSNVFLMKTIHLFPSRSSVYEKKKGFAYIHMLKKPV
jgi:hypothetical protein